MFNKNINTNFMRATTILSLLCVIIFCLLLVHINTLNRNITDLLQENNTLTITNSKLESEKHDLVKLNEESQITITDYLELNELNAIEIASLKENISNTTEFLSTYTDYRTDRYIELNAIYSITDESTVYLAPTEDSEIIRTTDNSFAQVYTILHNNEGTRWCLIKIIEEEAFRNGYEYGYTKIENLTLLDPSLDLLQYDIIENIDIDSIVIGDKVEKTIGLFDLPYSKITQNYPYESLIFSKEVNNTISNSLLDSNYAKVYDQYIRFDYNLLNSRINLIESNNPVLKLNGESVIGKKIGQMENQLLAKYHKMSSNEILNLIDGFDYYDGYFTGDEQMFNLGNDYYLYLETDNDTNSIVELLRIFYFSLN